MTTLHSPSIARDDNAQTQFVFHAFNAVLSDDIQRFREDVQDDMMIVIVDKLINQMRPDFRQRFLAYVDARIRGH